MSRAFVKEPDGDESAGEAPERPISPHPNYVTPRGLRLLRGQLADCLAERTRLQAAGDELARRPALARLARDIRYLETRLASAIEVTLRADTPQSVAFGSCVTVALEDDSEQRFEIVGEDEADPASGRISWVSPLARALDGAEVGDLVTWPRPSGSIELEVIAISVSESET